jgi:hypothetical protein
MSFAKSQAKKIAPSMAQRWEERRRLERKDFGQKANANMANKYAAVRPGMMR